MNAKITIITPTYNRAHTLNRVYESLKNQTFKDFKWLIMDDGSTDDTKELVDSFIKDDLVEIEYCYNLNAKKFYTVFKGVEKVKTDFFTVLDSDDAYKENALLDMYQTIKELNPDHYISATFNSCFPDGRLVGTLFPENLNGSILEMRYQHKVRGDKHSIFITKPYQKYLSSFDYERFKNLYAPQKIFFNQYDADGMKSKFVNQAVRIYYQDTEDLSSMSADRVKPSSYHGLKEGHLSFINSYGKQLDVFPKAKVRNIIGFQVYALAEKTPVFEINKQLKHFQFLAFLILPISFLYYKLKF